MARRNDKRIRLIEAADQLFYTQGFNVTTLANIASLANVPLGNVYYYFQSKEAIVKAVIERRRQKLRDLFAAVQTQTTDPRQRLIAFMQDSLPPLEEAITYGDSLGGLCQELGKDGGEMSAMAASLMDELIQWCVMQFKAVGKGTEEAQNLAFSFISNIQGSRLLALAFKEPAHIQRQTEYLRHWIQSL